MTAVERLAQSKIEDAENEAHTKAFIAEWKRTHGGRKPTVEDYQKMMINAQSSPAVQKAVSDDRLQGATDGRAWAEDGRSIAAVDAVYNFHTYDGADEKVSNDLYDKMVAEIGDDEEFEAMRTYDDPHYCQAWYDAVCKVFEEMQ